MKTTVDSKATKPKIRSDAKEARLKAALKANMGRRKAQARARTAEETQKSKGE